MRVRARGRVRECDVEVGLDRACHVGALPSVLLARALRLVVVIAIHCVCPRVRGAGAGAAGDLRVLRGAARA